MRAEIEQRIKSVYPTGRLWEPSVKEYLGEDYENRIWNILNDVASQTIIQIDANRTSEENQQNQYPFTFDADPCFHEWVYLPNKEKLHVIADRGRNVPVFWLSVSKVFPAYDFFYNVWKPRGDTGYLDTEFTYSPFDSDWATFHDRLFSMLNQVGLEQLPETEWRELVPFVFELEFDDDDDDAELELEDEGHLVPVNVFQCLFGGP